jgi:hypothetical protein
MKEILPENLQGASIELSAYFYGSLGIILRILFDVVGPFYKRFYTI